MPAPTLSGLAPSVTLNENAVNAAPQLLDADVTFTDADGDFDGGVLTLSGLLAEDRASVRNEGTGAGQIGLSGADVTFGGVVIGTLAGGVGGTLTITFNANATSAAIEALIQNLTYANVSDTPTASRDLLLNITDASGAGLGPIPGPQTFGLADAASNPLDGLDDSFSSAPAFIDIDGDGDLDLVVGEAYGELRTFENDRGVFTALTGAANPFSGVDVPYYSKPVFADVDGDGDLDLVVGDNYGALHTFRNDLGAFTELAGVTNPFAGVDVGGYARPAFVDIDGDSDLDLVVGAQDGLLRTFENNGGLFTERTGAANPFNGLDVGSWSTPTFGDLDGDGDLDLVVGDTTGALRSFENDGGAFTELTGADNPFGGAAVGTYIAPTLADVDGDGDLDLVVGTVYAGLVTFLNTSAHGQTITVNVTAEADAINGTEFDDVLTGASAGDVVNGLGGDDVLTGGAGAQTLNGGDDADTLSGRGGDDILDGGAGTDTADYSDAAAGVAVRLFAGLATDDGDGGSDTLVSIENVIGSALDDTLIGSAGDNSLEGGDGRDYLIGLDGSDRLVGGAGAANQLQGGAGDDLYLVQANDTLIEFAGEGHDVVLTNRSRFVLAANIEELHFLGAGAFTGIGNADDNTVHGGDGDDFLSGLGGDDRLDGDDGSDTADYRQASGGVVASLADGAASDDGDGGTDTLVSIENLVGSDWDDELTGDAGANLLDGGGGADYLVGGGGVDVIRGGDDYDMVDYSGAAAGVVVKLHLGVATDDGDGASDQLISVEDVTGSDFSDLIIGTSVDNYLYGGQGADYLIGLEGDDVLYGGTGAANQLQGGLGDDRYFVEANDTLVEFAGEGYDSVATTLNSYTLRANFEELAFAGVGDFVGTGNALDNYIYGGEGDDVLTGGGGDDVIVGSSSCGCGGPGEDTVVLAGVLADYVIEDLGGGAWSVTDTVADRDGVDMLLDIAWLRFSDGTTFQLVPADAAAATDKTAGDALVLPDIGDDFILAGDADIALVLPDATADEALPPNDLDQPLVLPGVDDDAFILGKDAGLPLVQPGEADILLTLEPSLELLPPGPSDMLTLDPGPGGFIDLADDGWLF